MRRFVISAFAVLLSLYTMYAADAFIVIETDNTALYLGTDAKGVLHTFHYGMKGFSKHDFKGCASTRTTRYGHPSDLSYPTTGGMYENIPALTIRYADGYMNTELYYRDHKVSRLDGVAVTDIFLTDPVTCIDVKLVYEACIKEDVIVCHAEITNSGRKPVELLKYSSSSMPFDSDSYLLTHFHGEHCGEMKIEHDLLSHGVKTLESRKGIRTTRKSNPSFMLSLDNKSYNENHGEVVAGSLAWSGNWCLEFNVDELESLTVTCGINPYVSPWKLLPSKTFVTPDMIWTWTDKGAGQASRNLHDYARAKKVYSGLDVKVPVLLNSWEGTYMDFNTKTLTDMIDDAAALGLGMFVLDDGWFGSDYPRDNASQGLGDWVVNMKKIPEGIDHLASYAHDKGLKFGIWIEPEMVNPKSNLAEKHPEWIVKSPGRDIPLSRNQWVLDLSNPKVQDYVFQVFDSIMKMSDKIDYVKWDCNRRIYSFGSEYLSENQGLFYTAYIQGFYSVMKRIRAKYPDVMIQSCSSGGGRLDYGVMEYFNEVWTSDNTDALSRVFIQYGTGLIYPASIMGAHVSAVPNHQTGNVTPLKYRFDVACSGRLGMELQPELLSEQEKEFAARALKSYERYKDIIYYGDLYRIKSPYETDYASFMYVSKDKKEAVLFIYSIAHKNRDKYDSFPLHGLDPEQNYLIEELNVDRSSYNRNGSVLSGKYLSGKGIELRMNKKYDSAIYLLRAR